MSASPMSHFKQLLDTYPLLASYWYFDQCECDLPAITQDIELMSCDEQIMLRFFVAIWFGKNRLNFDLIEATRTLNDGYLDDIRQWLNQPLFP